jgi:hypothetical protein
MARFFAFGHTPGPMPEPLAIPSRQTPRTLDLRRAPRRDPGRWS